MARLRRIGMQLGFEFYSHCGRVKSVKTVKLDLRRTLVWNPDVSNGLGQRG